MYLKPNFHNNPNADFVFCRHSKLGKMIISQSTIDFCSQNLSVNNVQVLHLETETKTAQKSVI